MQYVCHSSMRSVILACLNFVTLEMFCLNTVQLKCDRRCWRQENVWNNLGRRLEAKLTINYFKRMLLSTVYGVGSGMSTNFDKDQIAVIPSGSWRACSLQSKLLQTPPFPPPKKKKIVRETFSFILLNHSRVNRISVLFKDKWHSVTPSRCVCALYKAREPPRTSVRLRHSSAISGCFHVGMYPMNRRCHNWTRRTRAWSGERR